MRVYMVFVHACMYACRYTCIQTVLITYIHPCLHTKNCAYLPTCARANTPDLMLHKAQTLRGMFTQYSQPSVLAIKTATRPKRRPGKSESLHPLGFL